MKFNQTATGELLYASEGGVPQFPLSKKRAWNDDIYIAMTSVLYNSRSMLVDTPEEIYRTSREDHSR